jgi:hypothetical protein
MFTVFNEHGSFEGSGHRVGRVPSFSPVVGIGTPPIPHPAGECVLPPPPVLGGGAHSLAREGFGESQFRRGDIHSGTLYIYLLCGSGSQKRSARSLGGDLSNAIGILKGPVMH